MLRYKSAQLMKKVIMAGGIALKDLNNKETYILVDMKGKTYLRVTYDLAGNKYGATLYFYYYVRPMKEKGTGVYPYEVRSKFELLPLTERNIRLITSSDYTPLYDSDIIMLNFLNNRLLV